ncbi:DUF7827 domain-containing protein [Halorubrum distributum]|uniref:DUF7827 domain-containing protein n=1 Tax=Halorubrum distributum TaxID=29283 RepID=UPI000AFC9B67|nr:hypothetical protein [Halorubrum distributum]
MNTRIAAVVVTILLVSAATALAAPATAQSGPAVGFSDAETTTTQGDIATINLQLRDTDEALLRVHSADQQYRATVRAQDGDNDGTVSIRFNTFRGPGEGDTAEFTAVDGDDSADLIAESSEQPGAVLDTGRYNLIASTATTSVAAVLFLEPPGEVGSNTSVVAPETPLSASTASMNESTTGVFEGSNTSTSSTTTQVPTAATGDHVRTRFSVGGLGGAIEGSLPGKNLIYPEDSSPSARTSHTMQTSPNQSITMRSLTIDYGAEESPPPAAVYRLTRGDINTLGVDETGDGSVDRSVSAAIQNIQTSTDGQVTLSFDRSITVSENDTLLAVYKVRNPETSGSQDVAVTLTGEKATYQELGTVLYGTAGQGTLGYGIDLQFESSADKSPPTAPLSALNVTYESDANELVANTDTSVLTTGEYAVRLQTKDSAPADLPQVDLTERFNVATPDAEVTNYSISETSQLSVTASTNLAPENTVIIRADGQEADGGISQVQNCVATVQSDGTISCEFDFSESGSDYKIDVLVRQNDTIIAGPTRVN